MEDLSSTEAAYSKQELAMMCRHPVAFEVNMILALKASIESLINDPSRTRDYIYEEVRRRFDDMTNAWGKLGPSRAMARRLFLDQEQLFNILDQSLAVNSALDDLRSGKVFRKDEECTGLCCRKVL